MGTGDAFLGVDLGGTKVLALAARPDGTTLASVVAETPSQESAGHIVSIMAETARAAIDQAGLDMDATTGVGVASAGAIDARVGTLVHAPQLPTMSNTPVVAMLSQWLGMSGMLGMALLVLLLVACSAPATPTPTLPPVPGFATMEEAHAACEAALGPLYRAAADGQSDATADEWSAGRAVCQEARKTSTALLAEAEIAQRVACNISVLRYADTTDDLRACVEVALRTLDILVAREDHLDRLYVEGVTGNEVRRRYFDTVQGELDALIRWADAKDSGDPEAIVNADAAYSTARERKVAAYEAVLSSPVGLFEEDWSPP